MRSNKTRNNQTRTCKAVSYPVPVSAGTVPQTSTRNIRRWIKTKFPSKTTKVHDELRRLKIGVTQIREDLKNIDSFKSRCSFKYLRDSNDKIIRVYAIYGFGKNGDRRYIISKATVMHDDIPDKARGKCIAANKLYQKLHFAMKSIHGVQSVLSNNPNVLTKNQLVKWAGKKHAMQHSIHQFKSSMNNLKQFLGRATTDSFKEYLDEKIRRAFQTSVESEKQRR